MSEQTCPSVERLTDYCLGKLTVIELESLEKHVDECDNCQNTVDKIDVRGDTLVASLREPPAADPHRDEPALRAALQAASKPPAAKLPVAKPIATPAPDTKWTEGKQPQSLDDFLVCLAASHLLEQTEAREFLHSLPKDQRPADAKTAAVAFVNGGKLTAFQARALYQGKCNHLVVAEREILDLLGKGGMGNVYKARHRRLDRIEALKLIAPKKLDSPEAKQRFAREARAAAKLNHPNVVTTYDAGEAGGLHFLAMEYINGSDLARIVKERGPLPVEQAVSCILQAAAGLQVAHEVGIVHRDIKPHNLLLDTSGKVKILDMGLARINEAQTAQQAKEGLTQSGQIMGTIDFMSPEQTLDVHTVGPASDVYSLGCTLHYLLTGKAPFDGESFGQKMMAHHHQAIPSLCAARSEVPAALDAVFQKMLAKKVQDRYSSMAEVSAALSKLGSTSATPAPLLPVKPEESGKLDTFLSRQAHSQDILSPAGANAQLAVTQVAHRPTSKPAGKQRFLLATAATALLAAVIAVATIIYSIKTPQGEVLVEVAPEYGDEVKVIVSKSGKKIEIDKQDDWKVTLDQGNYSVTLDPQSKAKFTLDKQSVSISTKKKEVVKVTRLEKVVTQVENVAAPPPPTKYVLKFDGDDYIDIPNFKYDGSHPLTFEARLADWMPPKANSQPIFNSTYFADEVQFNSWISFVGFGLDFSKSNNAIHIGSSAKPGLVLPSSPRPRSETMIDLAVVFDGEKRAIYRNGRPVQNADFPFGSTSKPEDNGIRARIGGNVTTVTNSGYGYQGYIQHVRISKTARYKGVYKPPEQLVADGETMLLYRFDQDTGKVAQDLSVNKLDGKIVGAEWVRAGSIPKDSPPPPSEPVRPSYVHKDATWNNQTRSWYQLIEVPLTFYEVAKLADACSATPVIIDSKEENDFVNGLKSNNQEVWIGYVKNRDGKLVTLTGEPAPYENWNGGEGTTPGEKNVYMMWGGKHADSYPDNKKAWGCLEWKASEIGPRLLAFDGKSYVDIPNFKYDGSHPLTFEARLTDGEPQGNPSKDNTTRIFDSGFQDGNKVNISQIALSAYGIDLQKLNYRITAHAGPGPTRHVFQVMPRSKQRDLIDLAVVFDGEVSRLFINGVPKGIGGWTYQEAGPKAPMAAARIAAGITSTSTRAPSHQYQGFMQYVRISKTARYKEAYVVPKRLEPDADTMLLYQFDQPTGSVAKDLSANKLDGQIIAAKWVLADVLKPPPADPKVLAGGDWHDLLPYVDLKHDAVHGTWSKSTLGLEGQGNPGGLLMPAEVAAGASYVARLRSKFPGAVKEIGVVLPIGQSSRAMLLVNHNVTRKSGLDGVRGGAPGTASNNSTVDTPRLASNQTHELEISVRNDVAVVNIIAKLNGKPLFDWRGPVSDLSLFTSGYLGPPRCPGVVFHNANNERVVVEGFFVRSLDTPLSLLDAKPTSPEYATAQFFQNLGAKIGILTPDGKSSHNPKPLPFRQEFTVHYLDVGGTKVTDEDMRQVLSLPNLQSVHLWSTELGDPTFQLLGQLPALRSIESSPKNAKLTDAGVAALRPIAGNLETLKLDYAYSVTSAGLIALGDMPNLRSVDLTGTKCDEKMLEAVSRWPQVSTLRNDHLALKRSHVEILAKFPALRSLYNPSGKMNDTDLQYLRDKLPQCWISTGGKFYNCQFKLPGSDLIAALDVSKPPLSAHWTEAGGLVAHKGGLAEVSLANELPAEYDLHLVIAKDWEAAWSVLLPLSNGRQLYLSMDRDLGRKVPNTERPAYRCQIVAKNGESLPPEITIETIVPKRLTGDAPKRVTIQVRNDEVRILGEGELACRISGDFSKMPMPSADDQPSTLRLKCWVSQDHSFRLHQAHLDVSPKPSQPIVATPATKP